jgi:hypothetical protein
MIQTKEELFLAELGINPKEEIELSYGAKIKITDLLKKYQAKQLILSGVVLQSEQLTFDCELCEDDGVMITGMDCTCDKAPSKS